VTDPSSDLAADALSALLAATGGDTFVVLDADRRIRLVGAEAALLADRPATELIGMGVISAFGSAPLDDLVRRATTDARQVEGDARLGSGPERRFAVSVMPLDGGGHLLWLRDVTVLAHLTQVRRDFVANISHELRTPLTAIKLLAETLAAGTEVDDTQREFAVQIEREVDQMAQLVEELLDLSTIESGASPLAIAAVDPRAIVDVVAERIAPVAQRRGITVAVVAGPLADGLSADPTRLAQALLNLAHNAVKFSHSGGEIRLGWQVANHRVRWWVADDGVGVPLQHQDRIFERFYKVDRARARDDSEATTDLSGSAGLGLAIVRHIAEAHGGRAGFDSTEGAGSTFWIEIPY
jgi:two-component system phosphate regulon sensor histidine kinase PhoR